MRRRKKALVVVLVSVGLVLMFVGLNDLVFYRTWSIMPVDYCRVSEESAAERGLAAGEITTSEADSGCLPGELHLCGYPRLVLSEVIEEQEDNDTQPTAPYAWMRNGGVVDDDYDEGGDGSDDAKEHEVEDFKSERAAKARAKAEGKAPIQRVRRAGFERVELPASFDLVTGDLSFISQTLVLPALVPLLHIGGQLVMLVKPQFELQPGQVGKGGIVRDAALYAEVEQRIRACLAELGMTVLQWLDSPIEGGDGNREFFVHAKRA